MIVFLKRIQTKKKKKKPCPHTNTQYKYWYTPNGNDYESIDCTKCGAKVKERGPYEPSWNL